MLKLQENNEWSSSQFDGFKIYSNVSQPDSQLLIAFL